MSFLIFFTENPDHEIPCGPEIKLFTQSTHNTKILWYAFYDKKSSPKIIYILLKIS